MTDYDYPSPVSNLLTLGDVRSFQDWPDYLTMDLGPQHIPDLLRMVLDEEFHQADSDTAKVWAPVHAWRALAQLRAEAAAKPLTRLLVRIDEFGDDSVGEELPVVFGLIGPAAIPALAGYLTDPAHGPWARVAAAHGLAENDERHPDARTQCITGLTELLKDFAELDPVLNGSLVSSLVDLKAIEAAPLIEQAFAANCVDSFVRGDLEDVHIELGLLQERQTPKPGLNFSLGSRPPGQEALDRDTPEKSQKWKQQHQAKLRDKEKRRSKRKQAKRTRRKKGRRK